MADGFEDTIAPLRRQLLRRARSRLDAWLHEAHEECVLTRFEAVADAWTPLDRDQRELLVTQALGALNSGAPLSEVKARQLQFLPG